MKSITIGLLVLAVLGGQPADARQERQGQTHEDRDGERDQHGDWYGSQSNDRRHDWGNEQRPAEQRAMRHPNWGPDRGQGHVWRRGERIGYNDWNGAERIDYRQRHLRRPPHGYEWRRRDNQYVLVAVATGVIASIILNSGR
ncbi:RcnB family protein [Novosphingobium sp. KACC 22771]|uniref:RcnB family protein n=1 Tax=Novosphingobium sp. KACC 22771 TaxID=3025670 RepID=UPI00236715C6|nr:RcnB family protein [Novosphingobium sp. KACC 22771]WDF72510.1 RcnB family protein [Novosphingobium sp. KACC 22771]